MDVEKYESILRERKRELEVRLRRIEDDFEQPRNPDDDDRAIERNNDEVLEELGETGQRELTAIDAALARVAEGTYGTCVRCGEPFSDERLNLVPHTPFCQSCAASL